MKRRILFLILGLLIAGRVYASPTNSMSITTPTDATVVNAADETTRYNEVTTKFNAHSHEDTTKSSANTWTLGDNAAGNKTFAVSTDDSGDPAIRFNTTSNYWTVSDDGSTFSTRSLASAPVFIDGAQTITGHKTFTGLLTGATQTAIGTISRDQATATGTQEVNITPAFQPLAVIFFAAQTATKEFSIGFDNQSSQRVIYDDTPTAADTWAVDTASSINTLESAGVSYTGKILTLDTDGFTISWTRTGAPTGSIVVYYLAIR